MGVGNTQRYAIEKVKKLISNGKSLEEAVNYVNEHEAKKHNTFALMGDLFHAARGGRVSPTAAAVGSMLKIKPILYIDFNQGGKIEILEKVRTAKKAYKRVAELLLQDVDNIDNYVIFIGDFFGAEVKQGVKDYILELQPNAKIEEGILSASIGVHTGPDSIGAMIVDTRMLKDGK
jgi:DegV family protein with EDD domain